MIKKVWKTALFEKNIFIYASRQLYILSHLLINLIFLFALCK